MHVVDVLKTVILHVEGSIEPLRDIETINLELVFADLEVLERRIKKKKNAKVRNKKYVRT